jgi:FkbM family methyltransferase
MKMTEIGHSMIRLPRYFRRAARLPYRRLARGFFVLLWYNIIFRLVFGRWPNQGERQVLAQSMIQRQPNTAASSFRAVLSLFDQKLYFTPFSVRLTAEDMRVVEYAGVKIAVDVTEPVIGHEIERATYEQHMVRFFQQVLRPGMTMVDIGANIGLFSLLAASLVGKEGRVYSIEARGENARLLLYSATLNHFDNIHLLPTAVGDSIGYTLYQTHIGANGALMTKGDGGFDGRAILHPTSQVVPMARLDTLIEERIDLLKLDIEGAEGMALCGAQELIRSHRPIITSEASMEMLDRVSRMSLRNYLLLTRNLGYRQFVIERVGGRLLEVSDLDQFLAAWPDPCHIEDFAFVPAEKLDALSFYLDSSR